MLLDVIEGAFLFSVASSSTIPRCRSIFISESFNGVTCSACWLWFVLLLQDKILVLGESLGRFILRLAHAIYCLGGKRRAVSFQYARIPVGDDVKSAYAMMMSACIYPFSQGSRRSAFIFSSGFPFPNWSFLTFSPKASSVEFSLGDGD